MVRPLLEPEEPFHFSPYGGWGWADTLFFVVLFLAVILAFAFVVIQTI